MYSLIKITTKLILVKPVYATVFRREIINMAVQFIDMTVKAIMAVKTSAKTNS